MNSSPINYAFLAGVLEGQLKSLADDKIFLKMSEDDRHKYVRLLIEGAIIKAKEFGQVHGTD